MLDQSVSENGPSSNRKPLDEQSLNSNMIGPFSAGKLGLVGVPSSLDDGKSLEFSNNMSPRNYYQRQVKFDRATSMIHTVDSRGKETVIQININLFNIRMFALLMCKGTVAQKAKALYDIILGRAAETSDQSTVCWSSARMKNAFKKMIFFSEIFPKKYQNEFLKELISQQRRNISYKRSVQQEHRNDMDHNYNNLESFQYDDPRNQSSLNYSDFSRTNQMPPREKQKEKRNAFLWSDAYLIIAEENFD